MYVCFVGDIHAGRHIFRRDMCHRYILRTFTEYYVTICVLAIVVLCLTAPGNDICVMWVVCASAFDNGLWRGALGQCLARCWKILS